MKYELIIIPNTDYTARAVKIGTFDPPAKGYSFSYPVLNTPEICNLLVSGGEQRIQIERSGPTTWKFDKETSQFSIIKPKSKTPEVYTIQNVQELHDKMAAYFYANYENLMKKSKQAVKIKGTSPEEVKKQPEEPPVQKPLSQEELYQKICNSISRRIDCTNVKKYPELKQLSDEYSKKLLEADKITRGAVMYLKCPWDDDIKFYNHMEYDVSTCRVLTYEEREYFEHLLEVERRKTILEQ